MLAPVAPLLVLLVWSVLSFGGFIGNDFLPSPVDTLKGLLQLFFAPGETFIEASTAIFGEFRMCHDDQGSPFGLHRPPRH